MTEVPLTRGYVAFIDDEDAGLVLQYKWYAHITPKTVYARTDQRINGKLCRIYMHRFLLVVKTGYEVDHRDQNGLNNTRDNLRLATSQQNKCNRVFCKGKSKYKGVVLRGGKWIARVGASGEHYLGSFESEVDAAIAYDAKARELYGQFAKTNFTPDPDF